MLLAVAMLAALNPIHILLWVLIVGLLFYGLYVLTGLAPAEAQKPLRVVLLILLIIVIIWLLLPYAGDHP
jgi:hypothetical protein